MNIFKLIETECEYTLLDDFIKFKEIANRQKILGEGSEKMKGILNNWIVEWSAVAFTDIYMSSDIIRSLREFAFAAAIKIETAMFIPSLSKDQFIFFNKADAFLFEDHFNKNAFLGNNYVGPCYVKKVAESKNLSLIRASY